MNAQTLQEVRTHIDIVDKQIVQLLAQRTYWVNQVKVIKGSAPKQDIAREQEVIKQVTAWAEMYGADVPTTQKTYQCMMQGFVEMENK